MAHRSKRSKAGLVAIGACILLLNLVSNLLLDVTSAFCPLASRASRPQTPNLVTPRVVTRAASETGARSSGEHPRKTKAETESSERSEGAFQGAAETNDGGKNVDDEVEAKRGALDADDATGRDDGDDNDSNSGKKVDWNAAMKELRARSMGKSVEPETARDAEEDQRLRYLRLQADFDNFRKRAEKEKREVMSRTKGRMLEELLPVLDNFERAAQSVKPSTEGEEKLNAAYQALYQQMLDSFGKIGLDTIDASKGARFDANVHQAVVSEASEDAEDESILEEFRKGYTFDGKLLRASMVKVANNPSKQAPARSSASEDQPGTDEDENSI